MIGFWMAALALVALAATALVLPLWQGKGESPLTRSELNKRLYRRRLAELAEEREQGVLGDEKETELELQRSLLDDIPDAEQRASKGRSLLWLPGVAVLVVVSVGLYLQLGGWREVQVWRDASSRLGELSNRILVERDANVTEQDLQSFILALRTRLQSDGDDYRGWLLLGRLLLDGRDPESAAQALDKAYRLAPSPDLVAAPYAEALLATGDEVRAKQLLEQALASDPNNLEAHSTYAFMALQQEDYRGALARWQAMLPLLEKGSTRYQMIERSIAFARQRLEQRGEVLHGTGQGEAAAESGFPLTVTLADGIVPPEGAYLFVFAVVPDGPPMPIAVQRIPNPHFPVSLRLSDADAMMEGSRLADHPELQFKARLSASGNVMEKSGAFEGLSQRVRTGEGKPASIDIRIDHAL